MKKLTAVILTALTLMLLLTGCVHEDLNIRLNKNGTGSVSTTVAVRKDILDQASLLGGSDPFEGKETFETEYDGEKYIACTETKEYASFEEMGKALSELTYDLDYTDAAEEPMNESTVTLPYEAASAVTAQESDTRIFKSVSIKKDGRKYVFDAVLNPVGSEALGYDYSDVFKLSITVEMPAKISAYKNGTVDKKAITFDLSDMSKELPLYAECQVSSPVPAVIGIVLAVGAIAAFIVLKKRK